MLDLLNLYLLLVWVKQNVIFHNMTILDPSCFPYLPLFYILETAKVGELSSITQLFPLHSEFETSVSRCFENQF
jgi:hypothetical protein